MSSSQNHRWLLTLCGTGAFVILAGSLLPRMVTLPPLPALPDQAKSSAEPPPNRSTDAKSTQKTGPTFSAVLPDKWEPVLIGASILLLAGTAVGWFWSRRRSGGSQAITKLLRITAALPLRFNCAAYLVDIGGRFLLVGVDPTGIKNVIPIPGGAQEPEAHHAEPTSAAGSNPNPQNMGVSA